MPIHLCSSYLIVNAHLSCRDGRILSRESSGESVRDLEEYLLKFRSRRRNVTMQEDRDFPMSSILTISTHACGAILLGKALRAICSLDTKS